MKKVLFLGYDRRKTSLVAELENHACKVEELDGPIDDLGKWDLIVSFGYKHILSTRVLKTAARPLVNLHISYLPYNRGFFPNFWAFYDNTPAGVTIHEIDSGIDTGPILFQKYVNFSTEKTFADTYDRLIQEIEDLFKENLPAILNQTYVAYPQRGTGSYHNKKDLPSDIQDWEEEISTVLRRLDTHKKQKQEKIRNYLNQNEKLLTPLERKLLGALLEIDFFRFSQLLRRDANLFIPKTVREDLLNLTGN